MERRKAAWAVALACALIAMLALDGGGGTNEAVARGDTVAVQLLAINDLHGHLEPSSDLRVGDEPAGGVEYLATHVRRLRARTPRGTLVVSAGDLVGASPLLSALFADEPTVESMNELGLDLNAVGNHELDEGPRELRRLARRARFGFLAANTVRRGGRRLFPPFAIRTIDGERIALVGVTLEGTADVVAAGGARGLGFRDEAASVNALVPTLRRRGAETIVVLLHEGGLAGGGIDECDGVSGPVVDIVRRTSPEVDLFVTGHTHEAYSCVIDGRPVTSAGAYGRVVTDIDLQIDPDSGEPVEIAVDNVVVSRDVPRDPGQTALLDDYRQRAAPVAVRVVGRLDEPLDREDGAMGSVVAEAWRRATAADVGLVHSGGVRAGLDAGDVTYAEAFGVLPFESRLVTMTLTGEQLSAAFEQQHDRAALSVSEGFDVARIDPYASYRVTVNDFLARGGDGFTALREGVDRVRGPLDVTALEAYLASP